MDLRNPVRGIVFYNRNVLSLGVFQNGIQNVYQREHFVLTRTKQLFANCVVYRHSRFFGISVILGNHGKTIYLDLVLKASKR
jgi:hypothetical protein